MSDDGGAWYLPALMPDGGRVAPFVVFRKGSDVMGREVRMVPPGWKHPTRSNGQLQPLHEETWSQREEARRQWDLGFMTDYKGGWIPKDHRDYSYDEYAGTSDPSLHMPDFEPGTATHYMMYETCTEGTPISPAFSTAEGLARWLADNRASAFGDSTATYEQWLSTISAGSAVSAVIGPDGVMRSGVEAALK